MSKSFRDFVADARARIREIEPDELAAKLDSGADLVLVDVREPAEHAGGCLPGALRVPRGLMEFAADPSFPRCNATLSAAADRDIVVYCASGGRGALATAVLQEMGFSKAVNLAGGTTAWTAEGHELETGDP